MSRDSAVAVGLMVVAGLYWLGADQIRVSRLEGIVGAQVVPKGLAVSLAVLSALLIAQDLWRRRRALQPARGGAGAQQWPAHRHLRAGGMLLIGTGYLLLVGILGYPVAVGLLLLATMLYMGRRLSLQLVLLAAAGALLYYLLFVRFLDIPLPAGVWPDLWRGATGAS